MGLIYDPRGLVGVTTAWPGVAGVLHKHTNQQCINNPLKVMNIVEKE
jgi:hypothetical protein